MWNKDWRGYLQKLRWQAARALVPRRRVYSRGISFTLPCDNWKTHYRWETYNRKEPETLDWIDRWVEDGKVLFDIGANIGVYSIYAALRHPRAKVIAFEPEYSNLHLFKENIVENGLKERVEIYALALGRLSGLSHLHLQDLTPGAALNTASSQALSLTRSQFPVVWKEGICSYTLDRFCQETGVWPHAVKIDVDGNEEEVLEGAAGALSGAGLRSVLVELAEPKTSRHCSRLLEEAGLRLEWLDPSGRSGNQIWVRS